MRCPGKCWQYIWRLFFKGFLVDLDFPLPGITDQIVISGSRWFSREKCGSPLYQTVSSLNIEFNLFSTNRTTGATRAVTKQNFTRTLKCFAVIFAPCAVQNYSNENLIVFFFKCFFVRNERRCDFYTRGQVLGQNFLLFWSKEMSNPHSDVQTVLCQTDRTAARTFSWELLVSQFLSSVDLGLFSYTPCLLTVGHWCRLDLQLPPTRNTHNSDRKAHAILSFNLHGKAMWVSLTSWRISIISTELLA